MWMGKRPRYIIAAVIIGLAALTGCSAETASPSEEAVREQNIVRALPASDQNAFSTFFSRWSAYTLALGTGAAEMGEVYTGLARIADNWSNSAYCVPNTGTSYVNVPLSDDGGKLTIEARDGEIVAGTVIWDSEEDSVSSTLTSMVACNAMVYALCGDADPTGVQNIYNTCVEGMTRDAAGTLAGGPERLGDYSFVLTLAPDMHQMTFRGLAGA